MYQDKSSRKRRGDRDTPRPENRTPSAFPELTETDIQRAAAGIL
jgi:hypothetical protein